MIDQPLSAKRWNIFARELEDILATYHLGLGHLDDHAGIHREKVRRLTQSLSMPKSFPVLNIKEMEQVVQTLTTESVKYFVQVAFLVISEIAPQIPPQSD